jgi:hypothetical protein
MSRSRADHSAAPQGYDNAVTAVARLRAMVLAISEAATKTIGLVVTFGGIGLIVSAIIVFIAIQVRGERRQNREYRERPPERY